MTRLFLVTAFLLLTTACAEIPGLGNLYSAESEGVRVIEANRDTDAPRTVLSVGKLDAKAWQAIRRHLRAARGPARLVLSGPGGPYEPMMALAAYVQERPEIEVVAAGHCLSACAVVWTLAPNRSLASGAVLGFHGESCPEDCRPGSLSRHDHVVLAAIDRAAPILGRALRATEAFRYKGENFAFFGAGELVRLGVGRFAEDTGPMRQALGAL